MRRPLRDLLLASSLLCATSAATRADDMMCGPQAGLFRSLLPSVVNITTYIGAPASEPANAAASSSQDEARNKMATGSGFIVDPSGFIVTNYHVIEGAYRIVVTFSDGRTEFATVAGSVPVGDIALLKVHTDTPLPAVHWADSDQVQIGQPVFAVGNPLGLGMSVSSGIVSALNRNIMETPYDDFIQTDAAINHGNSGGPLFNMHGDVIGMDTAIISPTSGSAGLGFAIPSNGVHFIVDRLQKYGWVRPGWLGIKVEQVTPEIADAIGLPTPEGEIIAEVFSESPAAKAGLQVGDVIRRFGDRMPPNEPALLRAIVHVPIGETVNIAVWRQGQTLTLPATIQEWPKSLWDALNPPEQTTPVAERIPPGLGLSLAPLNSAARSKFRLPPEATGVLVTGVTTNTDAAHRGVAAGDVILRVQDANVASPADVTAALEKAHADKRNYAVVLLLQSTKASPIPSPRWMALRITNQ